MYKQKREQKGISTGQLSAHLGVAITDINQLETGKKRVNRFVMENYMYFIDNDKAFFAANHHTKEILIANLRDYKDDFLYLNSSILINKICKIIEFKDDYFILQFYDDLYSPTYRECFNYDTYRSRRIIFTLARDVNDSFQEKHDDVNLLLNKDRFVKKIVKGHGVNLSWHIPKLCSRLSIEQTALLKEKFRNAVCEIEKISLLKELFFGHIYLVSIVANRSKEGRFATINRIEIDDLFQVGCLELLHWIPKLITDAEMSISAFKAILGTRLKWAYSTYARETAPIKITPTTMKYHTEISKARWELYAELERYPSNKEIAVKIRKTEKHVETFLGVSNDNLSLDTSFGDEGDDGSGYHLFESSTYMLNPEKIVNKIMLEEAIKTLTEKQKRYMYLKYYKFMNNEQMAKLLDIKQFKNVTRIGTEVSKKIKKYFQETKEIPPDTFIYSEIDLTAKIALLREIFGKQESIDKYIEKIDDSIDTLSDHQKKYIYKRFAESMSRNDALREVYAKVDKRQETLIIDNLKSHLHKKSPRELILEDLDIEDNMNIDIDKIIDKSLEREERDIIHKKYYEGKPMQQILREMSLTGYMGYKHYKKSLETIKQKLTG